MGLSSTNFRETAHTLCNHVMICFLCGKVVKQMSFVRSFFVVLARAGDEEREDTVIGDIRLVGNGGHQQKQR